MGFIILQVFMIAVVIAFPGIAITDTGRKVDPSTIEIEIPAFGGGQEDGSGGVPPPPSFD